jgi:hypothetical protein
LRPVPGLDSGIHAPATHDTNNNDARTQKTVSTRNRVDTRVKPGYGRESVRPVFWFFFSKKNFYPFLF